VIAEALIGTGASGSIFLNAPLIFNLFVNSPSGIVKSLWLNIPLAKTAGKTLLNVYLYRHLFKTF
jgi:hypothetical protein